MRYTVLSEMRIHSPSRNTHTQSCQKCAYTVLPEIRIHGPVRNAHTQSFQKYAYTVLPEIRKRSYAIQRGNQRYVSAICICLAIENILYRSIASARSAQPLLCNSGAGKSCYLHRNQTCQTAYAVPEAGITE